MNDVPIFNFVDSVCKVTSHFSTSIENTPSSMSNFPLSGSLKTGNFRGPSTASSYRHTFTASTSERGDSLKFNSRY